MTDENGEPIDYTPENARQLFSDDPGVADALAGAGGFSLRISPESVQRIRDCAQRLMDTVDQRAEEAESAGGDGIEVVIGDVSLIVRKAAR